MSGLVVTGASLDGAVVGLRAVDGVIAEVGPQDVVVYVDQTRMGGPNTLAQIPITDVKEIQHLSGTDATQRYGTGHGSGVIIVIRK